MVIMRKNSATGRETDNITVSAIYQSQLQLISGLVLPSICIGITLIPVLCFSVRKAAAWNDVPVEDILEEYDDGIFTTPYESSRDQVLQDDLDDIPYVTDDGFEVPLFSNDGFQIQRRTANFAYDTKPHGVLIDLLRTRNLFTNDVDELVDDPCDVDFTVYPQSGLRTVGHFQAKGLISGCYPLLKRINALLRHRDGNYHDDEDNDDYLDTPAIHPIASQGYNAMMHHTRGRTAQHHEVQVGQVTAALAGMFANTPQHINLGKRLIRTCQQALPHQAFSEKIQSPAISTDLRLENVYYIDMNALRPDQRNGRSDSLHYIYCLA